MARRQKTWWDKMTKNVTLRLYVAAVWRYVLWLILLNFMWFVFSLCVSLLLGSPFKTLKETYFMAMLDNLMQHVGLHLVAFYLTVESLMQFGFKSGRYRLTVEYIRGKRKA